MRLALMPEDLLGTDVTMIVELIASMFMIALRLLS